MKHHDMQTIKVTFDNMDADFTMAKKLAENVASTILSDPMLIAWYDGIKKEEHPTIPECQHKPGWLAYAEGHDGRFRIDVNQNFSFIFTDAA